MWLRLAAIAVLLLAPCLAIAQKNDSLSLDDAFARVADTHPELRMLVVRDRVLLAERDQALLRPGLTASASLENALGTGAARGFQSAEITLSLASVFERGGKLDARRALANSRIDALAVDRETRRLDLLAETARRYLAVVAVSRQRDVAELDIAQRTRAVSGAGQRVQAGASPESVLLSAQVALARAELDRDRAVQRHASARQYLAALWGERAPVFDVVDIDPLKLPDVVDAVALARLLDGTPELRYFASEQRVSEARLQLARSNSRADFDWSVGVRRLQADDDFGLVASLSIPLGSRGRAQPGIRVAEAELAGIEIEREAKDMALYSTLVEAHGRYRIAQLEVKRLRMDILPKLDRAASAAERAYRAGAISYLEWAQLQSEGIAARKQQLDVALDAQRALIEMQRLTGQSLVTQAAPTAQGTNP